MEELCRKEVVSVTTAKRIGYITDVEVDAENGCVVAVCVTPEAGGMFRRPEPVSVPWNEIVKIGPETVLVRFSPPEPPPRPGKKLFGR